MLRIKVWLQAIATIALIPGALYLSELIAQNLEHMI